MIGAKRTAAVLRSGGTAALVYGQASMGVGNTMLHAQRSAVALASVPNGTVDVDIALVLADGGPAGHVDPAFAAHDAPICSWAAAVWNSWLPRLALAQVCAAAAAWLADCPRPWARVRGPAAAFLASARRFPRLGCEQKSWRSLLMMILLFCSRVGRHKWSDVQFGPR